MCLDGEIQSYPNKIRGYGSKGDEIQLEGYTSTLYELNDDVPGNRIKTHCDIFPVPCCGFIGTHLQPLLIFCSLGE